MLELWAIGRYDLGLTDREFGELTPALFEALLARRTAETKQQYFRVGILASSIINSSMAAPKEPVNPIDFVPGEKKEEMDLTKLSPEEQARVVLKEMSKKIERRV